MSRKREKPCLSRHLPSSKRRRPLPPLSDDLHVPSAPPAAILVIGLPTDCSVLDLKSRFEIYGSISRTRIDPHGVGFVTFRSKSAAESAISAALDPSFGITFDSKRVQVVLASDSKNRGEQDGGIDSEGEQTRHTSKLVRAEKPLSRHGRGNRLSSAIVSSSSDATTKPITLDVPFKGREIVAYDDLL
ncbi:hypothetical protein V2J09_003706 [Rumex salicifolius]